MQIKCIYIVPSVSLKKHIFFSVLTKYNTNSSTSHSTKNLNKSLLKSVQWTEVIFV